MKWFYNWKISAKLLTGFILVAFIAGVVGFIGISNIKDTDTRYTVLYEDSGVSLSYIGTAGILFQKNRALLRDIVLDKGQDRNAYVEGIKNNDSQIKDALTKFAKSIRTSQVRQQFEECQDAIQQFSSVQGEVINLALANQEEQALAKLRQAVPLVNIVTTTMDGLFQNKIKNGRARADDYSVVTNQTVNTMIVVIIIGMIVAGALGIFISRLISKPVQKMVFAAEKIALGDVTAQVEADTLDEIGTLMAAFGKMIANIREQALTAEKIAAGDLTVEVKVKSENDLLGLKLKEMVENNNEVLSNINAAAEQVSAGSKQVSISSQALSQGSTEQASSLEEITSSITEVAAQTKQNATNANQANNLAVAAKDSAIDGNQQMKAMLQAMAEINDSSANISKIIKVIDEIAFQTNILALNAAVEAARAGQHGKGFAVVAEEVRNLAARSANAAKETTDMIEGSIKKVEAGTKIANDTAAALNKIVESVGGATNLVAEIAMASNQQASAVTQINQGIEQVSQVVQSNTATAEESASASEELSSQAELLKNMVTRFKIKKSIQSTELRNLHPEMLKALEEMVSKKNDIPHSMENALAEAAPTSAGVSSKSKIKIHLGDTDFGKY